MVYMSLEAVFLEYISALLGFRFTFFFSAQEQDSITAAKDSRFLSSSFHSVTTANLCAKESTVDPKKPLIRVLFGIHVQQCWLTKDMSGKKTWKPCDFLWNNY